MSHNLKTTMDCVFGEDNFRNEIVWCYTGPSNVKRWFPRKHDNILFYANRNFSFNRDVVRIPYSAETMARSGRVEGVKSIISSSAETQERRNKATVEDLFGSGKIPEDWWSDVPILTNQAERTGYPTQKPLKLLERIIKAISNKNDVILDPFCGCATTCVVAERLKRKWIGIDISIKAYELVKERLTNESVNIWNPDDEVIMRTDPPKRTDLGEDYREHKFVYVISYPCLSG